MLNSDAMARDTTSASQSVKEFLEYLRLNFNVEFRPQAKQWPSMLNSDTRTSGGSSHSQSTMAFLAYMRLTIDVEFRC